MGVPILQLSVEVIQLIQQKLLQTYPEDYQPDWADLDSVKIDLAKDGNNLEVLVLQYDDCWRIATT